MIPTADLRTIAFDRVFLLSEDEAHAPSAKTLEPLSPAARESVVRMALRRLAFQVLFELDMGGRDRAWAADALSRVEGLGPMDAERVAALATGAWEARAAADTEFLALAPDWPSHRLAAADRAILRLAHFEMVSHTTAPKVVVSEAVELARHFSTEKSPAFVNGLLDRVLHRIEPSQGGDA